MAHPKRYFSGVFPGHVMQLLVTKLLKVDSLHESCIDTSIIQSLETGSYL